MGRQPPVQMSGEEWRLVCEILRQQVPDREVWAFGSRATGTAKPYSDLDLAIIGITPLGMDRMAAIRDTFSESELPWKLDLVDWASASASFRKIIERDKVVLQRAPSPGRATKYGMGE
jgi:type I restriction enzyme S subunit